ncbi:hypothetical protein ACS0TY_007689 [Phlomoides rotata]
MLIKNIDPKSGLYNGTRLIVTKLGNHVIEAHILLGKNVGERVLIPIMTLTVLDVTTKVKFRRKQFSIYSCALP